jgi:hypothetical protein
MSKKFLKNKNGQALLLASFFLFLILSFSLVLVSYLFSNNQTNLKSYFSSVAYDLAEAGIEKAIWCLNQTANNGCGGTFGPSYIGESNISLGDGKFSTTVTRVGNSRTIVSTGIGTKNVTKKIKVEVTAAPTASDVSFSYAIQVDAGGVTLQNNSSIYGSVYSNSNVSCNTNSLVSGDVTVSGASNKIDKCKINYDAMAHSITNSNVGQNAYYTNISSTTVGGTKYPGSPDPIFTTLPTFNLPLWENLAANGGTVEGNYSPLNGSSLGPKKINGDLTLNNNVHLTITGPVWVTGNITINNNCVLTLDFTFGDNGTLIIADNVNNLATYGKIMVSNNVIINGAGEKSFIVFISTNNSNNSANPAINLNNNAEGAIFLAPDGMIILNNNARVKSLSANSIYVNNNAEVHYQESELINLNFAAGPGGNWQIKKSTWQDLNI